MAKHLIYDNHKAVTNDSCNALNGKSYKTLTDEFGELPIDIACEREGRVEPLNVITFAPKQTVKV